MVRQNPNLESSLTNGADCCEGVPWVRRAEGAIPFFSCDAKVLSNAFGPAIDAFKLCPSSETRPVAWERLTPAGGLPQNCGRPGGTVDELTLVGTGRPGGMADAAALGTRFGGLSGNWGLESGPLAWAVAP